MNIDLAIFLWSVVNLFKLLKYFLGDLKSAEQKSSSQF